MWWEKGFFVCPCSCSYLCICDFEKHEEQERKKERKRGGQGGLEWMEDCQRAAALWRGVLRCGEITGRRRRSLTFAVHNAVVFVVFRSLPSHIQQPPGAGAQHHRDRALRLLHQDR